MKKKLEITGSAKLSVRPDLTRLHLTMEGTEPEYDRALEVSSQKTQEMQALFENLGFSVGDLKTVGFQVNPHYEDYQEDGNWKRRFQGYRYSHQLKLEFAVDSKLLGKILAALGQGTTNAQINIQYSLRDPEAVKEQLLGQAIANSQKKAQVICEAAGIELGEIISIRYAWETRDYYSNGINGRVMAAGAVYMAKDGGTDVCAEPDDIEIEDSVLVVWNIL